MISARSPWVATAVGMAVATDVGEAAMVGADVFVGIKVGGSGGAVETTVG